MPGGPTVEIRSSVAVEVSTTDDEEALEAVLSRINTLAEEDLLWTTDRIEFDTETAENVLADIEAWASLASYAVAQFYTGAYIPPQPVGAGIRRRYGFPYIYFAPGWDRRIVERLRRIAKTLERSLRGVCAALAAASYSVSVAFPWGVSVSIGWTV